MNRTLLGLTVLSLLLLSGCHGKTGNSSNSSASNSIVLVDDNPDLGTLQILSGNAYPGEEILFQALPINSNLAQTDRIFVGNEEIAVNPSGQYRFTLGKEVVTLHASFKAKEVHKAITRLALTNETPTLGQASLKIDKEPYAASVTYQTGSLGEILPQANAEDQLDKITLNGKTILTDGEKKYSFALLDINDLSLLFKTKENTEFIAFQKTYGTDYASVDFTKEVANGSLKATYLGYVAYHLLEGQTQIHFTCTDTATSTAFFITNTQSTMTWWEKKESSYTKENITYSGNVKMAEKMTLTDNQVGYQRVLDDAVTSTTEADFSSAALQSFTYPQYFATYHVDLTTPSLYRMEPDSFTDGTLIVSETNGYALSGKLNLDCLSDYRKYMVTTTADASFSLARQSEEPVFRSVILTLHLDKNLRLLSSHAQEDYDVVSSVGNVATKATAEGTYSYGE